MQDFSKKGSEALQGLGKTLSFVKTAAVALAGAFALGKVVDEAVQADNAIAKLGISLKLSGEYSRQALADLEAYAGEIQKTTGFTDDMALQSLALAKNLGLTNDSSKALVKTAADLARVTGGSLTDATNQLIGTYSGQLRGLSKLFPALKDYNSEQLKAGAGIELIASKIGGTAEALNNTFGGALQNVRNSSADFLESIGQIITRNPVIIAATKQIALIMQSLAEYFVENRSAISGFLSTLVQGFASAMPAVISTIQILVGTLGVVVKVLAMATIGAVEFLKALMKWDFMRALVQSLISGIAAIAAAIFQLIKLILSVPGVGETFKLAGFDVDAAKASLDSLTDVAFDKVINDQTQSVVDGLDSIGVAAASALDATDAVVENIGNGLSNIKSKAEIFADALKEVGKTTKDALLESLDAMKSIPKEIEKITSEIRKQILQSGTNNPANTVLGMFGLGDLAKDLKDINGNMKSGAMEALAIGTGMGVGNAALQGQNGAKSLISGGTAAIADAFLPGSGQFAGNLMNALMAGPERRAELEDAQRQIADLDKVIQALENDSLVRPLSMAEQSQLEESKRRKQELEELAKNLEESNKKTITYQVREFAKAIPEIIKMLPAVLKDLIKELPGIIVDAIPELIDAFAEALPDIIVALVEAVPKIVEALFRIMPKMIEAQVRAIGTILSKIFSDGIGRMVEEIGRALINLPIQIVNAIIQGLSSALGGGGGVVFGGEGDIGSFENAIGVDLPGYFAKGGIVPPGFPNDTYPAMLSSDEMVLPRPVRYKFQDYMDTMSEGSQGSAVSEAKLDKVISLLEALLVQGQHQSLTIEGKQFAEIIRDVTRRGFRTT
ncbi:hypothetical protein [Bdellovibrio bacteriovorus]|uniref:hypothetical protein n=1 Tax=Bdellovibrio bacteriovorus TaxID=959 RepID=UPI0035A59DA1